MKQFISYDSADSIQTDFCVFNNGNIWQVKRKTAAVNLIEVISFIIGRIKNSFMNKNRL